MKWDEIDFAGDENIFSLQSLSVVMRFPLQRVRCQFVQDHPLPVIKVDGTRTRGNKTVKESVYISAVEISEHEAILEALLAQCAHKHEVHDLSRANSLAQSDVMQKPLPTMGESEEVVSL